MAPGNSYGTAYRGTAIAIILHIIALFLGFTILGMVFDFPDILRVPAAERLGLFSSRQRVIQSTYWLPAMTGFSHIFITDFSKNSRI